MDLDRKRYSCKNQEQQNDHNGMTSSSKRRHSDPTMSLGIPNKRSRNKSSPLPKQYPNNDIIDHHHFFYSIASLFPLYLNLPNINRRLTSPFFSDQLPSTSFNKSPGDKHYHPLTRMETRGLHRRQKESELFLSLCVLALHHFLGTAPLSIW